MVINKNKHFHTLLLKSYLWYLRFYIRQKFGADLPVNWVSSIQVKDGGADQNKIEKFLKAKKKKQVRNFTKFDRSL